MDYRQAWKVRWIQMLIVNILCGGIGIWFGVSTKEPLAGVMFWVLASWMLGAMVAMFSKNTGRIAALAFHVMIFIGETFIGAFRGGLSFFAAFLLMFAMIKVMFGMIALTAIYIFELVAYPITTIVLLVKSR